MRPDEEWKDKSIEIYVHIPFCLRKCRYCDFLSFPAEEQTRKQYVQALIRQIRRFETLLPGKNSEVTLPPVRSIFFGGGTPSLFGEEIAQILGVLREQFPVAQGAEISIECNPGTVDRRKLECFRAAGINRLSMGLQSMDDSQLHNLGRIHTRRTFLESYALAREAGFDNINIDLMFSLPGQDLFSWEKTLKETLSLKPEHISAYSLIIEEGTPFYGLYHSADELRKDGKEQNLLPDEDTEREMDQLCESLLADAGLYRYEISNYARPGKECIHNIGYWTRKNYIGFGLGAASLWKGVRFQNTASLPEYLNGDFERKQETILSTREEMEETMFLGLRLTDGVSIEAFRRNFGESPETVYKKQIAELTGSGLLCVENGYIKLTSRGRDLANPVMAAFL